MRTAAAVAAGVVVLFLLLSIPAPEYTPPMTDAVGHLPFVWNQDAYWASLESTFVHIRGEGCTRATARTAEFLRQFDRDLDALRARPCAPGAPLFAQLEHDVFSIGPSAAACPALLPEFSSRVARMRDLLKRQSERWDMTDLRSRVTLYRLLYGSRSAVEEAMLQLPPDAAAPALTMGTDEPSATPSAMLLGMVIHSGDILVSRGGAPTSALIARGNDFPGNFSHVAMAWVDPKLHTIRIIESHIERGVAVSGVDDYLKDTKLRVMVLRLRSDLPALRTDPLLPHRAATIALDRATAGHIPYDFAMNWSDTTKYFCSEVVSDAYRRCGINLWMGMSRLSSPGLRRWLADFGVREFTTQEPSDLEYDPQIRVVGEWRDPETLRQDHVDNAVTEAMLEGAERGDVLSYPWYELPIARGVKGWSVLLNWFGRIGPVPEGMDAAAALKHETYARRHREAKQAVLHAADAFRGTHGYAPPYWGLLPFARAACAGTGGSAR